MRLIWVGALCAVLFSCALQNQAELHECPRDSYFSRGAKDASLGRPLDLSFSPSCTSGSRVDAIAAYRDGFASQHPVLVMADQSEAAPAVPVGPAPAMDEAESPPALRAPASPSWVCEVESNSKIFTGVGATREEALGSARATCGSHFQAAYCSKADCKQNL
jgi:hypothetical protein